MIRAGLDAITFTSRDRNAASSIECVTSTIVFFVRSQISSRKSLISSRVIASSAPNGSSIINTSGSSASARALADFVAASARVCYLHQQRHVVERILPRQQRRFLEHDADAPLADRLDR